MCGISGLITLSKKQAVQLSDLEAMTRIVTHRGPDGEGYFIDENQDLGLGHRRLAIIDTSIEGQQPRHYGENKRFSIVFNGEIYNYIEIKAKLQAKGYHFQSQTDTEVILAAYDFWGKDCVREFNGMWAFLLLDKQKNELFCSRDRFGVKPLYYATVGNYFALASEIKQFTVLPAWKARLNVARAYDFLDFGYKEHTPETFFEGVQQLGAGCNLIYDLTHRRFEISQYYDLSLFKKTTLFIDRQEAIAHFGKLLEDAVRLRLRSDVPVGMTLSGGIDSSAIAGYVAQLMADKKMQFPTFSSCHRNFANDETPYIDAVIAKHGLPNHKIYSTFDEVLQDWEKVTWFQDGPVQTLSVITHFRVLEAIQTQGIKVILAGQGADEILAGYEKFYEPHFKQQLHHRPWALPLELVQFLWFQPNTFFSTLHLFKNKISKRDKLKSEVVKNSLQRSEQTLQDCSLNMIYGNGLQSILHHEDRNGMGASLETRCPFLDYRLMEFSLALPDHLKIYQSKRKYILREATKTLLPTSVYHRYDKLGFPAPQQEWLQQNQPWLQQQLKQCLTQTQGLVHKEIFDELNTKTPDYKLLWRAVGFGLFMEKFDVLLSRDT